MAATRTSNRRGKDGGVGGDTGKLARFLAEAALEKKAENLVILDLRGLTSMTDYFVIGTVSTAVHARAVRDHLKERAAESLGERPWHVEGESEGGAWTLMDYVDVVVHLFHPDARTYYALDRLWGDAAAEKIEDGS